ncbi:MAG TPA: glycosyltransferase family 39 protein [Burkholderiales bacterium]|nr:glycosyltransferase family 39 protein [Burkholderiales bacterium]
MNPRYRLAIDLSLIALLAVALYAPFLGNPRVFDDRVLFSHPEFFERLATRPFGIDLRVPGHFTLAFTEVMWGRMEAHRIIALALHVACAVVLYRLLARLLGRESRLALAGAVLFAIHPVAVYGAGYLAQRPTVLATLFGLLSLVLFIRGLDRRSHADALSAALMYTLAVLCKEHVLLLPAVALLSLAFAGAERRFAIRHAALYLVACTPAALLMVALVKSLIGTPYEQAFEAVTSQMDAGVRQEVAASPWLASAITQMGLFFKYLGLWLAPNTHGMSIDVRIDFAATAAAAWTAVKTCAFVAYAIGAAVLLRRGGRAAIIGFGLLYAWILFLVELTAVRFQEPFVLYRSYLWAPGIVIAVGGLLAYLPRRIALAAALAATPVLLVQAHDRLQTFASPLALWEDAAGKLQPGVPGGYRTLFQLGRELLYSDQAERAIATAERCIAEYPTTVQCYLARGTIALQFERYAEALPYLTRAVELDPRSGIAHHHRGLAFQELGDRREAIAEYEISEKLDFPAARTRLRLLREREVR